MSKMKDRFDFQDEINSYFGFNNYTVHSSIGGVRGEMTLTHNICQTTWTCCPRIINKCRKEGIELCIDCRKQINRKNLQEKHKKLATQNHSPRVISYLNKLKHKTNIKEFSFISLGKEGSITLKHNKCGMTQKHTKRIKNNPNLPIRCKYCIENGVYFKENLGSKFKMLTPYKIRRGGKTRPKVWLKHLENNCLHEFEINTDNNPTQITCPKCVLNDKKLDFRTELQNKYPNEFELLSEYNNLHEQLVFSHNNDFCEGKPFETIANNLLRYGVCQSCLEKQNSYLYVSERVHELLGSSYSVIKDTFISNSDFEIRHNETDCSHKVFKNTLRTLESGRGGCPVCGNVMSINERKLYDYFIQNNIPFEQEKTFPDFKYKDTGGSPRFDFYLVLNQQELLIEYDGEHHYRETAKWSTSLETVQQRDRIKTQYALDKQIPLLRISYLDKKNLIPILETFLKPYLTKKEPN